MQLENNPNNLINKLNILVNNNSFLPIPLINRNKFIQELEIKLYPNNLT